MKFVFALLLFLSAIAWGIFAAVAYTQAGLHMANLQLADDASTPEQKSEFLHQFIDEMDHANLPEYAAWIWRTPRNKLSNQRIVLGSLVKRCDDLAKLNKESMGYAQGMAQITGQEFDHTMRDVREIYEKAFYMSYGWLNLNAWWIISLLLGCQCLFVAATEDT